MGQHYDSLISLLSSLYHIIFLASPSCNYPERQGLKRLIRWRWCLIQTDNCDTDTNWIQMSHAVGFCFFRVILNISKACLPEGEQFKSRLQNISFIWSLQISTLGNALVQKLSAFISLLEKVPTLQTETLELLPFYINGILALSMLADNVDSRHERASKFCHTNM